MGYLITVEKNCIKAAPVILVVAKPNVILSQLVCFIIQEAHVMSCLALRTARDGITVAQHTK